jgi:large subunit ribosomal protein L4e
LEKIFLEKKKTKMKTKIYTIDGKQEKEITLPTCFNETIREDLIQKIIEAKKVWQPYAPSPVAGNQYAASGKMIHQRKVWKSQYGRGMSRVPRKIMSRRGSQFNWVGATVPNTRGGRRAHVPKVLSMISLARINKKELKLALMSALSATVFAKWITKRYERLKGEKITNLPLIVESKITTLKSKEVLAGLKKILGEKLYGIAIQKKTIRKGIGKLRGRKYKNNAGMLLVLGNEEKLKTTAFDVQKVNKLGINDLANGGVGRLTMYTEKAIKDLGEKFK